MEINYYNVFREIVGVLFVLVVGKLWMSTGAFWSWFWKFNTYGAGVKFDFFFSFGIE
jgi:hypothetical protein